MMIDNMDARFYQYWQSLRFQLPTPIQESVFEPLKEGKDVIGLSPTGTGKTLAYALPLLEKVRKTNELQLVILAPSQELAVQVGRVVQEWASLKDLQVQTLIGSANINRQIEKLKDKPEVVVGTPGRLLELAEQRKLKLHQVQAVVLDEADYLLQEEHLPALRELIRKMPGQRQMAFFSATANELLDNVSAWFNVEPLRFDASQAGNLHDQTTHGYVEVPNRKRAEMLRRLGNVAGMQALVFVNAVSELDYLAEKLLYEGVPVRMLHSDYSKDQRQQALEGFRKGRVVFLLTTDLAARGLDIADLPYVIHYDLPLTLEQYLHRSGRTGRMGKEGRVLSLVTDRTLRDLKKFVPDAAALQQWFVYGGQLLEERPEQDAEAESGEKRKPSAKPVQARSHKAAPSQSKQPAKKPKKKNRARDQKNKGARRKKDS